MGAVVQILGAANRTFTVFTDAAGYYAATGLLPGFYTLKVTLLLFCRQCARKSAFAPAPALASMSRLSTLLGVMQLGPIRVCSR